MILTHDLYESVETECCGYSSPLQQWSNMPRLRWIRGHRGDLQGVSLVITSVFGCAEVSDHHSAAGEHNLAVFCLLLIKL